MPWGTDPRRSLSAEIDADRQACRTDRQVINSLVRTHQEKGRRNKGKMKKVSSVFYTS